MRLHCARNSDTPYTLTQDSSSREATLREKLRYAIHSNTGFELSWGNTARETQICHTPLHRFELSWGNTARETQIRHTLLHRFELSWGNTAWETQIPHTLLHRFELSWGNTAWETQIPHTLLHRILALVRQHCARNSDTPYTLTQDSSSREATLREKLRYAIHSNTGFELSWGNTVPFCSQDRMYSCVIRQSWWL